ncbi:YceI family protein [Corynebacterium mastitidis]|uniref:YceI family protein n=1 Tax=Corynebacterium mastitidis TaxID=161890 RepID=UPI0003826FA2|nr:YceI family protein [Corynebacterium mastitidis]
MPRNRKIVIAAFVTAIILIAVLSILPTVLGAMNGPGVKTEGIDAKGATHATTDMNGHWEVTGRATGNTTSAGYTFHEILPGDKRVTSGSTTHVEGSLSIEDNSLVGGLITVDMTTVASDNERRDINVRTKILETETHPTADFEISGPVDLTGLPDDGTMGEVRVPGRLTLHGHTRDVEPVMKVLRSGDSVVVSTDIEIDRADYAVETPDFVAASIDEHGQINVRLALEKNA